MSSENDYCRTKDADGIPQKSRSHHLPDISRKKTGAEYSKSFLENPQKSFPPEFSLYSFNYLAFFSRESSLEKRENKKTIQSDFNFFSYLKWFVGMRVTSPAWHFMHDLKSKLANRVQLTTDAPKAALTAVDVLFGNEIDQRTMSKQSWLDPAVNYG